MLGQVLDQVLEVDKIIERYEELAEEREIDKTTVLVECYHGNDLRGMGYYIAMDLAEHPEYKVYVAAADLEKVCAFS